jgi:hypothetical protein
MSNAVIFAVGIVVSLLVVAYVVLLSMATRADTSRKS